MKALVVDDSKVMRKILIGVLDRLDISDVSQAENGAEAVHACVDSEFNLVLMDWNMPKKSGFEALEEIRKTGNKVPIIMVTTEAERARIITALKAGANDYIIKPIAPDIVIAKITKVLNLNDK